MKNFHHVGVCPIRDIISKLGDKWSLLVLVTLNANGVMRFTEIQKTIGDISQRMLTVTLRSLEDDGLVIREVYPQVPHKVEYYLPDKAKSLILHIGQLVKWALENESLLFTIFTPQTLKNTINEKMQLIFSGVGFYISTF